MRNQKNMNRRQFVEKAVGVAGASLAFPYIVPSAALGVNGAVAPSDRVTMGFIGVGLMGQNHFERWRNPARTYAATPSPCRS